MADFNFEDYPEEGSADFNFDDYPTEAPEQGLGEKITRGALNTLPVIGGIAGGIVGGAAGIPALGFGAIGGGVVGAGLGSGAGEALKNFGENYFLGEEKTREQIYKDPALAIKDGMMYEMGGQALAAVPGLVKEGASKATDFVLNKMGQNIEFTPVANKEAIEQAAKTLNINNVPKAVLTDNKIYQDLESGLSQSGSLPSRSVRDQYDNFFKNIDDAAQKIAEMRTPESDFAIGGKIQKELGEEISKLRAPVSELYENVTPELRKIPVDEGVVNKAFGALKRNPLFQTKDGIEMLEEYKSIAASQPELASLKEWRSTLSDSVGGNASPLEVKRIEALRNTITSIRDNSIEALKTQFPKSAHKEIDNLISEISLADSAHASNIADINSVKGVLGNKSFGSPTTFLNKLAEAKEGDVVARASNLDISSLKNMQQKFPAIFEKAKTAKINEMIQNSTNAVSGFNEARFIKQYDAMDKELKELIFAPEMQAHIESLKTIKQAIPAQLGPSGTPKGLMTMDMFSPRRNVLDYGIKKTLEMASGQKPAVMTPIKEATESVIPFNRSAPALRLLEGGASGQTQFPKSAEKQDQTSINKDLILQKTQGTKYQKVLQDAAAKSEQSLAAAHFVLAGRDPIYRKTIEGGE